MGMNSDIIAEAKKEHEKLQALLEEQYEMQLDEGKVEEKERDEADKELQRHMKMSDEDYAKELKEHESEHGKTLDWGGITESLINRALGLDDEDIDLGECFG